MVCSCEHGWQTTQYACANVCCVRVWTVWDLQQTTFAYTRQVLKHGYTLPPALALPALGQTQQRFGERIKQHVPRHILDSARESTEKRRGRPPKKRENPEDYPSAVACHLAANKECCLSYDDSDFRVLARCRSKLHLNILEAMYIHVLKPVLWKQKSFVANLTLFKHAHSTHSHKHTE